ncbi:hypothetical protein E8E13_001964 [Curvularia kusanoi]|uniref:HET-domain-containing protein n=1 Tax=Curvularia kusanoi TaxID=90978 RepID=A0A9P4T4E8_CURKU|nr:hypothetical protein E8E13_001964 [Curvularia kusanoi]
MRLLNVHTKRLHTFYGSSTPKYAILSHTWLSDHEEVIFSHIQSQQPSSWSHLPGAKKVDHTCQQAANDGYEWAWIDTCCIDKTNNAELSEAINSMFQWYQRAQVCYVYLLDVDSNNAGDIFTSRWWSRAWTLQELVAPANVQFFDEDWRNVGSRSALADEIALEKHIDSSILRDPTVLSSSSVAQRMCWAAQREATREEDLAYALLGIFNINMTMQYGEGGEAAFVRLQKEIMRTTKDMSIFAWGFKALPLESVLSGNREPDSSSLESDQNPDGVSKYGLLASRPSDFAGTHDIISLPEHESGVGDVEAEEEFGSEDLSKDATRM